MTSVKEPSDKMYYYYSAIRFIVTQFNKDLILLVLHQIVDILLLIIDLCSTLKCNKVKKHTITFTFFIFLAVILFN